MKIDLRVSENGGSKNQGRVHKPRKKNYGLVPVPVILDLYKGGAK